jgi:cytochrome c5
VLRYNAPLQKQSIRHFLYHANRGIGYLSPQELHMLNLGMKSRLVKLSLLVLGISVAGTVVAQSARNAQIAERLSPVGQVCLAGEACASSGAAPAMAAAASGAFNASTTYDQYCAMCHNTGMANAPRKDDATHWDARIAEVSFATVVANAIAGVGAMPARGMCATCSDEDIASLVEYLSGHSAQ